MKGLHEPLIHVLVLASLAIPVGLAQSGKRHTVEELFAWISEQIQTESSVPFLKPSWVPSLDSQDLYAIPLSIDNESYHLMIATNPDCQGQNNCLFGSFSGSSQPLNTEQAKGIHVMLRNKRTAKFIPAKCYAFCGEAYLEWRVGRFYYEIGVKAGNKDELIRIANSMTYGLPNADPVR